MYFLHFCYICQSKYVSPRVQAWIQRWLGVDTVTAKSPGMDTMTSISLGVDTVMARHGYSDASFLLHRILHQKVRNVENLHGKIRAFVLVSAPA